MSFKFKFSTCKILKAHFGERLAEMAAKTKIDGREHGIRVCQNGGLVLLTEYIGDPWRVAIRGTCPPEAKDFFDLHTHPEGQPMSYTDISKSASARLNKECIIRNKTLECAEGLQKLTISPNIEKYNQFMDQLPLRFTWEEIYPKYKQFLESMGVKFCQEEL